MELMSGNAFAGLLEAAGLSPRSISRAVGYSHVTAYSYCSTSALPPKAKYVFWAFGEFLKSRLHYGVFPLNTKRAYVPTVVEKLFLEWTEERLTHGKAKRMSVQAPDEVFSDEPAKKTAPPTDVFDVLDEISL